MTTTTTRELAARTFRVDVKGAEVRERFAASGIRAVLLKGPAFTRLLFPGARSREYVDVDLLVEPAAVQRAEAVLVAAGFRPADAEAVARQTDPAIGRTVGVQGSSHARTWLRECDRFTVDLHDSLPQCAASPQAVWRALTQHLAVLSVAGEPTEVLDRPASALLVALHAAHHGPGAPRTGADLEAALGTFDANCWRAAGELAVTLGAEVPMGVGLGMSAAGAAIAHELGLVSEPSAARQLAWSGAPWSATVLAGVMSQRSPRVAIAAAARILWPAPVALRRGSALARRGRGGLVAAYALRPFRLARSLPAALLEQRRVRS